MISSYKNKEIGQIDKNLLRGLYIPKLKDFDEDIKEVNQNKTLFQRLKRDLNLNSNA